MISRSELALLLLVLLVVAFLFWSRNVIVRAPGVPTSSVIPSEATTPDPSVRVPRSFAALRMTRGEGLRMTRGEGLGMTRGERPGMTGGGRHQASAAVRVSQERTRARNWATAKGLVM